MLASGLLRERITLESPVVVRDELGGEKHTWKPQVTVWAAIDSPSGREANVAQQVRDVISYVVVVRPLPDVTARWRVRWGLRILSIAAVLPAPSKDRTTLLCSEGLDQSDH